jgi:diguanylate cyclase (GGDEF)-like protein/PAS domain S-box-containing protein
MLNRLIGMAHDPSEVLLFTQFAMDNVSTEILWLSSDARIHYANNQVCKSLGYTKEELLQLGIPDIDPLFPIDNWNEHWENLKRDKTQIFETQHRRKNGEIIPVQITANYVKLGNIEYNVAYCKDISERKKAEANARLNQLVLENTLDGFWQTDNKGDLLKVNQAYANIIGYTVDELLNMHVSQLDAYDNPEDVRDRINKIISKGALTFETQHRHKAGHLVDLEVSATFMPETKEFIVFCRDISVRKNAEAQLRESEKRLSTILDSNKIHMWAFDGTQYTYTNKEWFDYTGQNPNELLTIERWTSAVHPDDLEESAVIWLANWEAKTEHDNHFRLKRHDGVYRYFLCHAVPIFDEQGVFQYFQGFNLDITERKNMEDQIRQLAFYDALTHLPNRRMLQDRLSRALAMSKRTGRYGALMFIDLDNFKPLNDQYGHNVGDLLLIEVANRLTNSMREIDTVARFGGDEFVVMLSELETDQSEATEHAALVAQKILSVLSEPYEMLLPDGPAEKVITHFCTASIGVAMFVNHQATQEELLKWADIAMYYAKDEGRNAVRFYSPPH